MHQILARATRMYMILARSMVGPPAIQATRSKEKRPTRPQLIPPIIVRISAILFIIIIYMTAPFHKIVFEPIVSVEIIFTQMCGFIPFLFNLQKMACRSQNFLLIAQGHAFQFSKHKNEICRDDRQPLFAFSVYIL